MDNILAEKRTFEYIVLFLFRALPIFSWHHMDFSVMCQSRRYQGKGKSNNATAPRTTLFFQRKGCPGWDLNPQHYAVWASALLTELPYMSTQSCQVSLTVLPISIICILGREMSIITGKCFHI